MKTYPAPASMDGKKFATRYGLSLYPPSFWIDAQGLIHVPDGLPDDPPIFDLPDPKIPCPAGIFVHEMRALSKKQGNELVDGDGTTCFHIVVQTEAQLSDPWFNGVNIDPGSVAYVQDKSKTLTWNGTAWK